MQPQLFLLALVAPLALSLPQPITQGESGALIARQESGNFTGGGDYRSHGGKYPGPPGGHHPERALKEGESAGNSTWAGHSRLHEHHDGPPHKERDLSERQESGNYTGGAGKGGPHDKPRKHWGPPHKERDLSERQESGNSTGGDEKPHHHKFGHPGPKVDKRMEEANGTTTGHVGKGKFTPDDGYHGGPQRSGEHKRSIIDMILDRR